MAASARLQRRVRLSCEEVSREGPMRQASRRVGIHWCQSPVIPRRNDPVVLVVRRLRETGIVFHSKTSIVNIVTNIFSRT